MTSVDQRIVLAPGDGSAGPLLRLADDCLAPGTGYGEHEHRAVDVVAVVVRGEVRHRWGDGVLLRAGDVAVLRGGTGLVHDEVAGAEGGRVLQCYLRSADPAGPAAQEVHRSPAGWVPLGRPDVRLWHARVPAGAEVELPPGLLVVAGAGDASAEEQPGGRCRAPAPATLLVWQWDAARPAWARD